MRYPNNKKKYCKAQEELFCWYLVLCSLSQILHKSQSDLNYHIAKNKSALKPDITFKCKLCYQKFSEFYALRQHRYTQHGMQIGSGTRVVGVKHIVGDVEDHRLREELRSCQHFLVDSEIERERHQVFNYAVETLNETIVIEKLDHFFQMCSKNESGFWFRFEKYRRRRVQIILRTRKQYPSRSMQSCVHQLRLGKVERLSQPN